jgi:ATP-dependent protease HslVU (ClpYQ) ATPase subunit
MTDFFPREIVSELDRFIIGQADAKREVVRELLDIATEICVYTNRNVTVEKL